MHYYCPITAGCMFLKTTAWNYPCRIHTACFPLIHYNIAVSLWKKKKPLTVIALLHRSTWKWIFKYESLPPPHLPHPFLPDLIWTGTSLQPCLLFPSLCGEMEKHKSTFWDSSQEKGLFSGLHYNKGDLVHIHLNFPIIIEVLYLDLLLF